MEDAVAAEDELAAGGRDRSGLKALLPARGIGGYGEGQREGGREGSGTPLGNLVETQFQSVMLSIEWIEFVKLGFDRLVL